MSKLATRPGAGAVGSAPTGGNAGGTRQGNTPAVVSDLDSAPQRHRSANKKVEINSQNLPVRQSGKKPNGK